MAFFNCKWAFALPVRLAILSLSLVVAGCNTGTFEDGSSEAPAQVCSHNYVEPVFNISYATDAISGMYLPQIVLRNVTVNGKPITDYSTVLVSAKNIQERNGALVCTLPCGLGVEEGSYQMFIDAPGYQTQVVNVRANYRVYSGGCPSYSDLGYYVTISLEP